MCPPTHTGYLHNGHSNYVTSPSTHTGHSSDVTSPLTLGTYTMDTQTKAYLVLLGMLESLSNVE